MRTISVFAVLLLTACSSAPSLFTSDGRPTKQIACSGASSWDDCFAQAEALCPGSGYDILARNDADTSRSILIACRRSN
jgi:hypothetical protein